MRRDLAEKGWVQEEEIYKLFGWVPSEKVAAAMGTTWFFLKRSLPWPHNRCGNYLVRKVINYKFADYNTNTILMFRPIEKIVSIL